jgi:hypothetical protein
MPRGHARTPETEAVLQRERREVLRRGDRLMVHIARVELALADLSDIDKLLVLNTTLDNVLHDSAGGR